MKNPTTSSLALILLCSCEGEIKEVNVQSQMSSEQESFEAHYFRIVEGWLPLSEDASFIQPPQLRIDFFSAKTGLSSCSVLLQGQVLGSFIQDKIVLTGLQKMEGNCPRSINKKLKPDLNLSIQIEPLLDSQRTNIVAAFAESGRSWEDYSSFALGGMSSLYKREEPPGTEGAWFLGYEVEEGELVLVQGENADVIRVLGLLSYSLDEFP